MGHSEMPSDEKVRAKCLCESILDLSGDGISLMCTSTSTFCFLGSDFPQQNPRCQIAPDPLQDLIDEEEYALIKNLKECDPRCCKVKRNILGDKISFS